MLGCPFALFGVGFGWWLAACLGLAACPGLTDGWMGEMGGWVDGMTELNEFSRIRQ